VLLTNGDGCPGWPVCPPWLDLRLGSECGFVLLLFGWHFEVRLYAATVSEVSSVALRGLRKPRTRGLLLRNKRHKIATPNKACGYNVYEYMKALDQSWEAMVRMSQTDNLVAMVRFFSLMADLGVPLHELHDYNLVSL